ATVSLATASDADFDVLSSTELNFSPGNTDETITIATKDDSVIEADEVFVVTLSTTSPSVQIDKVKGVTTITINDNDGLSNPTSSSNANTGVVIGAVMAAVVVLIVILIVACLLYRRKRKNENTPDTGNIQNAAFEGDTQPRKPSSEIPYSDYEEPAKLAANDQSLNTEDYAQLDISKRTPIDANYQSLNIDVYAQLDSSKRVPIDANYQSLNDMEGYAQLDSSKRVPIDANYQSLDTEGYAELDSSKRVPIDANYQSLETRGQMEVDKNHNENVLQSASSNIDSNSRNEVPDDSAYEIMP
ncbi:Hypothetical predicted protein, partial [Paramuricea clavata]